MKRAFDIIVSLSVLLLIWPLLLVIAVAVRLRGGAGPILFRQARAGRGGKAFDILKFRTMVNNAEQQGAGLAIVANDSRITPIGAFLRRTSLDELPQFINVLRGEMSLVGPRPLPMKYVPRYSERQRRRLEAVPGITGLAQVNGRNALTWDQKFETDVRYVEQQSFLFDLRILWRTAWLVIRRQGLMAEDGQVTEFMGSEGGRQPEGQA